MILAALMNKSETFIYHSNTKSLTYIRLTAFFFLLIGIILFAFGCYVEKMPKQKSSFDIRLERKSCSKKKRVEQMKDNTLLGTKMNDGKSKLLQFEKMFNQ